MDRYTRVLDNGTVVPVHGQQEALKRLAQYEERIELSPEEIIEQLMTYSSLLMEITGNRMSKTNYTLEAILKLVREEQDRRCEDCEYRKAVEIVSLTLDDVPVVTHVSMNLYDKEETYHNCTVQVLTNTETGEQSVGWFENDEKAGTPICFPGDIVYQTDGVRVYAHEVRRIIYDAGDFCFNEDAIGHSVWLTREQAEKAMRGDDIDKG